MSKVCRVYWLSFWGYNESLSIGYNKISHLAIMRISHSAIYWFGCNENFPFGYDENVSFGYILIWLFTYLAIKATLNLLKNKIFDFIYINLIIMVFWISFLIQLFTHLAIVKFLIWLFTYLAIVKMSHSPPRNELHAKLWFDNFFIQITQILIRSKSNLSHWEIFILLNRHWQYSGINFNLRIGIIVVFLQKVHFWI